MGKLPEKKSTAWYGVTGAIFAVLLVFFIVGRILLGIGITFENILGFALISAMAAGIAGVGGFMGGRVFFTTTLLSYLLGSLYMLYIAASAAADTWSDIVSVVSFMFFAACGVAAGVILQLVVNFSGNKKQKT